MLSRFFINRPIFATVIAVIMIIVGIIAVQSLPVAQYPQITPPTVQVSANYPGADAKTVAETVGVPIEEQVNGVEGMMYMSSNSGNDGSYSLTITFDNDVDLDIATVKVQNRVALAQPSLPSAVQEQGVDVTSQSTNVILFLAIEGDSAYNYSSLYLTNYAKLNIVDELARIDGVGGVNAFGAGEYSMRIWLDPKLMEIRGVTTDEVLAAVRSQNMEVSAGSVGAPPQSQPGAFQYTLTANGRLTTPEEFGNIIITSGPSGILRLKDIARIDLGSEDYTVSAYVSNHDAGLLGVYQLPGANALEVAKNVKQKMEDLKQYFPPGVHYRVILDSTDFVSSSIDDVLVTFAETTLIVMIVILIFLQNWRAVIIPMLTIPVSLIATFAVMKLLGFTLNTLTLFGLVLAIAIVVDDAIVVVEDCARILDKKQMNARQAALKAMNELQGPIVGEVLVLLSVFIPTAFISGITGELYKQFALTIAISTAFSGFNALTFTPAMCALFLKPRKPAKFFIYRWFNAGWAKTLVVYTKAIAVLLKKPVIAIGFYLLLCAVAFWGFIKWPTSYIPEEDMGYFIASVQLPTGASLERTEKVVNEITDKLMEYPEVENVLSFSGMSFLGGGSESNGGSFFVVLKPWNERKGKSEGVKAIMERAEGEMAQIQEGVFFAVNPPAIPGLGMSSGLQMELLDINNYGAQTTKEALDSLVTAAAKDPSIASITTLYEGTVPQFAININRDKLKMQGLTNEEVFGTLSAFMGEMYVDDFTDFGRVYQVNVSGSSSSRAKLDEIMRLNVRNSDGDMVPFSTFTTVTPVMGEPSISRYNMYQSASLTANPSKGTSTGDGIKAMEQLVHNTLRSDYSFAWTGEAYQESNAGTTISVVLVFAIIMTLLVLAAQYESIRDPFAVIFSMPTAILGTIVGCFFLSQSISIYTQIGIILLLGLSAKNAILIVEYARDFHASGETVQQSALSGGKIRFRPIMMTALAFVFGVMPMLFATGAGAASQISLGCAVVFGMAINAIVGTLFVPTLWELVNKRKTKTNGQQPPGGSETTTEANSGNDV